MIFTSSCQLPKWLYSLAGSWWVNFIGSLKWGAVDHWIGLPCSFLYKSDKLKLS